MVRELSAIEVDTVPELSRLVEEVERTRQPRALRRHGETVAMLVPVGRGRRPARRTLLVDTSALPPVPHRSVDELGRAAIALPRPFTRDEIKETVDADRADAWRAKYG